MNVAQAGFIIIYVYFSFDFEIKVKSLLWVSQSIVCPRRFADCD